MKTIYIIGAIPILGFVIWFFACQNYRITKQEVIALLRKILEGADDKYTGWSWDDFTHIPIKNDPYLENIRKQCLALELDEFLDPQEKAFFNERGFGELKKILAELENNKNRL